MNNTRRKQLIKAHEMLEQAHSILTHAWDIIDEARNDEQDAFDNMPESIQDGEKGERMQEAIDNLDNACSLDWDDLIREMQDYIEEAVNQ